MNCRPSLVPDAGSLRVRALRVLARYGASTRSEVDQVSFGGFTLL
jgi:hypothetical protein